MQETYHKFTVLQILPSLGTGGVELATIEAAEAIKASGNVSLVASSAGPNLSKLLQKRIRHFELNLHSKNPFKMMVNIYRLVKIIKQEKVDILHARSRAPAWSGYFAAKFCKIPFVTTFHGVYSHQNIFKRLYNSVMVKGDVTICVSDYIMQHVKSIYQNYKKLLLITEGLDFDKYQKDDLGFNRMRELLKKHNIPENKKIILHPGRVTRLKGQDLLIKAFASIDHKDLVLVFAGGYEDHAEYFSELEKLVKKLEVSEKIIFAGNVDDIVSMYKISSVVISSSLRPEAFDRVAIEAGALGKPVVAANVGGPAEIIIDGKTGFLYKIGDYEDLALKINSALELSQEELANLGKAAQVNIIKNYNLKDLQEKLISAYRYLLAHK